METTIVYCGYMGIMENKMGTTLVDWGSMGIMEKRRKLQGLYRVYTLT